MKEILAIIRPNMVAKTGKALEAVGFPAMTVISCFGRGKERGYIDAKLPEDVDKEKILKEGEKLGMRMKYIPKRMISIVVDDADVPLVVGIIMKINKTGKPGDGKIFVMPIDEAIRIRTGEFGIEAIGN